MTVFRIPKQFGLRTMLMAVALVAVTIVVTRDYVRLQSAREQFNWINAAWMSDRVTYDTVVAASYPLMDAEESTLWISKRTAQQHHVERLKHLLDQVQSPVAEQSHQEKNRRSKHIIEQIRSVDPATADALAGETARKYPDEATAVP